MLASVSPPTQLQSLTEIILLPTRASWPRPNYLSRFSVFNENSCGNFVSIKQVKEKQENNFRYSLFGGEDFYLERAEKVFIIPSDFSLKLDLRAGGQWPGARTNGIAEC